MIAGLSFELCCYNCPSRALASIKGGREKKEKGGKGGKEKERGKKEKINAS